MFDAIVLLIIIFFILAGLRKGFGQYLLELSITALSLGAGWLYYQQRQQLLTALAVFLLVFLALSFLNRLLLRAKQEKDVKTLKLSLRSLCWGATLGFAWGVFISVAAILALDLLPAEIVFSYGLKKSLRQSHARRIVYQLLPIRKSALLENISYIGKVSLDKDAQLRLKEQPAYQELLQHEKLKAVMEDPELVKKLQNKNLAPLLANPKIINLLNDGQFVEKLMQLDFKKAAEEQADAI